MSKDAEGQGGEVTSRTSELGSKDRWIDLMAEGIRYVFVIWACYASKKAGYLEALWELSKGGIPKSIGCTSFPFAEQATENLGARAW